MKDNDMGFMGNDKWIVGPPLHMPHKKDATSGMTHK